MSVFIDDGFSNDHMCTVFKESCGASILVYCPLNSSQFIGYVVIMQYSHPFDSNRIENITVANTTNLNAPVTMDGIGNGLHYITVFPLLEDTNLIGSEVIYRLAILLDDFGTAVGISCIIMYLTYKISVIV